MHDNDMLARRPCDLPLYTYYSLTLCCTWSGRVPLLLLTAAVAGRSAAVFVLLGVVHVILVHHCRGWVEGNH